MTSRINRRQFVFPESDRREQHERDCIEVEGASTDFKESDLSPPARV
jgi:hypothetical protein